MIAARIRLVGTLFQLLKVSIAALACWVMTLFSSVFAYTPPNIILCVGDDHGWEETGYNGHPYLKTPILDSMAATGLRLDRFYAAAPVCSPTRGSIITGRHPNRYGTFSANWSIRPEEIGVAQILARAGYACAHFGKWHLGPVKAESPTNPGAMGFERWLSHDNFFEVNPFLSRNGGPPERFEGESSEILVDEAIRFLREAKDNGRRFFVAIWFGSPHEPYVGLPSDLALYDNLPQEYEERTVRLTDVKTGLATKRPLRDVLRERYAEITAMDRAIGKLRQFLEKEGLRENTLLWYLSDNGTPPEAAVMVPFRGMKGSIYDGGLRVPSVMEWPAVISRPRASDVNCVTSDILPTLCDLTGQPLPNRPLDGVSLKPVIFGEKWERPSPICFWQYDIGHETRNNPQPYIDPKLQEGTTPLAKQMGGRWTRNFQNLRHLSITEEDFRGPRAILENQYKLVIIDRAGGTQSKELFDVREDPAEKNNLIDMKPDIARQLEQKLRTWQESVLKSLLGEDYK
ncbi:MAG TPA: sulfatase-like hydrolase/transferase [Thermogutta sp.]|nr:sulfatase-like hydrolase/transferase [Thermogutta sp.]